MRRGVWGRHPGLRVALAALTAVAVLGACGSAPTAAPPLQAGAAAACTAAPLGDTPLYLRGTMNQWQADEAGEFAWRCSAYQLNVRLAGEHRFKIADDGWRDATILANAAGVAVTGLPPVLARGPGTAELRQHFAGAQTLTLRFGPAGPQLTLSEGHFDDARQRPVTHPVALSLHHDSRALADKRPFGAVPAGTEVQLAFSALPGVEQATLVIERRQHEGDQTVLAYHPLARVPMQRSTAGAPAGQERFTARHRFDAVGVHGYWFEVRIAGEAYVLQNNLETIPWTREKGSNGLALVGRAPDADRKIRRLRLSVFKPDFQVPAWAADAVYYFVFPERFRNGDPGNDPQPGQRRYQDQAIERHARWNEAPFKPGSGDGSDKVFNNDFFGGDLAGIIDKLDYIRALGANAVYMTPVFTAPSNHKYDTADFKQIDPAFGNNAEFTRLTQEAARRGIRVVPDASLNHVGSDSVYFDRYGNHSTGPDGRPNVGAFANARIRADSPWASWFTFDATQTTPQRQYRGWAGEPDLPELNKAAPGWRHFAYGAPDSITRTWLQRGAAGWRMDVAPFVPDDFWREWRSVVKQTDPNAITIAETWHDASRHLLGDMFDSTMNYIFRNVVLDYAAGGPASAAVKPLELLREQYPPQALHALMNLLSSHDVPRALHQLGDTRLPGPAVDATTVARARQRLRLATLLQMSYPGAPAVYYGDEVGLTGGADPYNRAPYPWADQGGQPDMALHADVTRMVAMRHAHPVLRRGALLAPLHADDAVLVLARRLGEAGEGPQATWAITAFNNAEVPRTVTVTLPEGAPDGPYAAAWGDAPAQARAGRLTLTLPALAGQVLVKAP